MLSYIWLDILLSFFFLFPRHILALPAPFFFNLRPLPVIVHSPSVIPLPL